MQLEIDILSISNLIAIIISGFLAFHFLFLYTSNWKANVFLGIFLLLTSLSVGIAEIESVNNQQIWSPTLGFLLSPILFSAILFHYVLASTKTLGSKWRKSFWMFLVAFIFSAINLSITEIAEEETLRVVSSIVFLTSELISLIILVLIMREIKAHNRNILRLFSTLENKQLNSS